jgi:hypothetical protein
VTTTLSGLIILAGLLVGAVLPTETASGIVTSAIVTAAPSSDSDGYAWVSYLRGLAGLGAVSRNATLEAQELTHMEYLANHALPCETDVHNELTTRIGNCGPNRYATVPGKAAANNSDITRVSVDVTARTAVTNWFSAGFHALALLDPRLTVTGYASYYTPRPAGAKPLAWQFSAGVDVYRGRNGSYNKQTVAFPSTGAVTPVLSYTVGTESPEPFRTTTGSCRSWGTKAVVSAPVIVQWPLSAAPAAGAAASGTIVDMTTGKAQPTCTLNANSYPAGSLQRQFLAGANGITKSAFYYAASAFTAGHTYQLREAGRAVTTFRAGVLPGPATIRGTSPAPQAVVVRWNAAAPGIGFTLSHYTASLYTAANCGGGSLRAAAASGTSAKLAGLVSGHTYWVRVATVNNTGAARWGGCVATRAG